MGAGHSHAPAAAQNRSRLGITLVLTGIYMLAEVAGGLWTGSLALLADAGHMLSDVAALALSLFAVWMAQKPATSRRTYGYYRTEILAALANGATLVAISVLILAEAWERFSAPPVVAAGPMMLIAFGGLLVNVISLWVLGHGNGQNLNVRGAYLHVLTDAMGSVGALVGGAAIWWFGWNWVDPAVSVLIACLVVYSAWDLLTQAVRVLMEGAPRAVDVDRLREQLAAVPGVEDVHDLHVWTISSGLDSMSVHLVVGDGGRQFEVLQAARKAVHDTFGIDHITIQIEPRNFDEHQCSF